MYLLDKINISKRTFTDEGYLIVNDARIARSGIQEYFAGELGLEDRDPFDVIKLYRPPEEVFKKESMDSFSSKPVTNNHPEELVNTKNARDLTVGHSGEIISRDGIFLTAKLVVTDDKAIRDIQGGKVELSNGYTSDIEFTAGVNDDGEEYDAIQTNIKGNHIAIVNKARCGDKCKISDELNEGKQTMKLLIDGLEFDCSDNTMAQAVNKVLEQNKTLNDAVSNHDAVVANLKDSHATEISDLKMKHKTETDTLQAKVDDAESNKVTPELLDSLVEKRTGVIAVASKVVENFDAAGKDCVAIRKEVVQHVSKDLDLTDKSEDYINARFDAIAENVADGKSNTLTDAMRQHARHTNDDDKSDSEKAREKSMVDSRDAWKHPVGKKVAS